MPETARKSQFWRSSPLVTGLAVLIGSAAAPYLSDIVFSGKEAGNSAANAEKTCTPATKESASELLLRLFPNAQLYNFDHISYNAMESGCLLEVEMLADKNNPNSRGFVYVLPDGKRFLNGPLMDKRSRVMIDPAATNPTQPSSEPKAPPEPPPALDLSGLDQPSSAPAAPPLGALPEAEAEQIRQDLLSEIKSLPAIETQSSGSPIYVLFDPQCVYCRKLYAQHEKLANQHKLSFVWVPIFLNDQSWAMSAFLLKTARASTDEAKALLKKIMEKTWNPKNDADGVMGLTQEDYAYAKNASLAFYGVAKKNPGIGTPLVVFEAPGGKVEVISGLPRATDWDIFTASSTTAHTGNASLNQRAAAAAN